MEGAKRSPMSVYCLYISVFLLAFYITAAVSSKDEDIAVMDQIQRINRNSGGSLKSPASENVAIIESDIRLPPVKSAATSGEYSNALRLRTRLWPGGVVPYVIDNSIVNRTTYMEVLRKGMEIWENNTCVKFVPRTNQYRYARIFYGSKGCNSNIGALWRRPSEVSLGLGCNLVSIVTHELGHLLGFGHEQNRPDRDHYIDILWENVKTTNHKAFKKHSHWSFHSFGIPYDYNSIMHYGRYHFSKNGEPTMVPRDPKVKWFGNRYPSKLDIKQMNLLYSCPEIPLFPDHFSIRLTSPSFLNCISINQSRDTEWGTRYLCNKPALKNLHITWSPNGSISGQDCINTIMPYERSSELWANSFLCFPRESLLKLSWSTSGPLSRQRCLLIRNGGLNRNGYFLCGLSKYQKIDGGWSKWSSWRPCNQQCGVGGIKMRMRSCDSPVPKYGGATCNGNHYETVSCNTDRQCSEFPSWPHDFTFMFLSFTPKRKQCIRIYERYQYIHWARAQLCWVRAAKRYIDIRWSDSGNIPLMRCTKITQQSGSYQTGGWQNNYLCIEKVAPYFFKWSTNGTIKGLECIRWQNDAFSHQNLWQNNYLCASEYPTPTRSQSTGCYPEWHSFFVNRVPYCYLPSTNKYQTWNEAREFCERKNSTLVSVTSKEEQDFIKSIFTNNVWIGFHKKRDWEWTDGSHVTYLNWNRGEPNNGGPSNVTEECVMQSKRSGKWNDFPCDTKFNFICKAKGAL